MLKLIDNSKPFIFLQSPSSPKEFSQPLSQFQKLWIFSFLVLQTNLKGLFDQSFVSCNRVGKRFRGKSNGKTKQIQQESLYPKNLVRSPCVCAQVKCIYEFVLHSRCRELIFPAAGVKANSFFFFRRARARLFSAYCNEFLAKANAGARLSTKQAISFGRERKQKKTTRKEKIQSF